MDECNSAVREYFRNAFRWRGGRQQSGYDKMLLVQSRYPLPFDVYLLRFAEGSGIPPHTDPVAAGRHYRCNIVLKRAKKGGEFLCSTPIVSTERIKLFRPDVCEHSVTCVELGTRYVLSIGWIHHSRASDRPSSA